MFIEAEAIPYEPALLRGERLLVLAPHPDDEAIACGGLVAQHLREGRAVHIIVATDGGAGGDPTVREEESRLGMAVLGTAGTQEAPESRAQLTLEFLRLPDRALGDDAAPPIRERLLAFRPDLVLVPSPIEIHPDHFALARVFCELVQRDESLFADLAVARVAFYEVGQPLRPNALVDITDVADAKYAAIAEHASQAAERDYTSYARGLNMYRAMTLPPPAKFAEGYWVVDLPALRTMALSELRTKIGAPIALEVQRETLPISVVIRTKDRRKLLLEAIDSVRATGYPCELVVVNDGGAPLELPDDITLVQHETSLGRAEAANAGVRAAKNAYVAFLDDDDLFYPEHLATLANAVLSTHDSTHAGWYTDAVSAFLQRGYSGEYETQSRLRTYAQDYDPDLLLLDNFIPLPTLLVARQTFLDLGGFDTAFDLFEDWDFLIRLSRRGDLQRIPRITCEVRHFAGGSSVVLAAPEGSPRFREAKLQLWKKHAALLGHDVFANVLERQKRRLNDLTSDVVTAKGAADAADRERVRLEREKQQVLVQNAANADTINGYALRVRELEASLQTLTAATAGFDEKLQQLTRENDALRADNEQHRRAHDETHAALERTRVEAERLRGLLDMIFRSKTWKVHTMLEKLRGRG